MPSPLKSLAVALGLVGFGAPAQAAVTLINVFEVPADRLEEAVAAWEAARDFLSNEPGYLDTTLHQALAPDARFQLVNVAQWESPEAFQAAIARMQAAGVFPRIAGVTPHPALYRAIRSDGLAK